MKRPIITTLVLLTAFTICFRSPSNVSAATTKKTFIQQQELKGWEGYTSRFYYLQLSQDEKKFYQNLLRECNSLLSAKKNPQNLTVEGENRVVTGGVKTGNLSQGNIAKVITLFEFENPQFYFLQPEHCIIKNGSTTKAYVFLFPDFKSKEDLADGSKCVLEYLNYLNGEVQLKIDNSDKSQESIEKAVHDTLCENLVYDDRIFSQDLLVDDAMYTQTIYGAMQDGTTVCAGYAKLYSMLCNVNGLECSFLLSDQHVWNMIRYDNHWYTSDVTWDDNIWDSVYSVGESPYLVEGNLVLAELDSSVYKNFKVTEKDMRKSDNSGYHQIASACKIYAPAFTTKYSNECLRISSMPKIKTKLNKNTITITTNDDNVYYCIKSFSNGKNTKTSSKFKALANSLILKDKGSYEIELYKKNPGEYQSKTKVLLLTIK